MAEPRDHRTALGWRAPGLSIGHVVCLPKGRPTIRINGKAHCVLLAICTALMVADTASAAQLDGWVFVKTEDPLTDEVEASAVAKSEGDPPHTALLSCKTQEHRVHFSVQGVEFVDPHPTQQQTKLLWRFDKGAPQGDMLSYENGFAYGGARTREKSTVFAIAKGLIDARMRFVIQGRNDPVVFPVEGARAALIKLYAACGCTESSKCQQLPH